MCEALLQKVLLRTIVYIIYSRICLRNLPREFTVAIYRENWPQDFAVGICRRNLPWLFATRIFLRNLLWKFTVAISSGFFVFSRKSFFFFVCEQILFIWKQTFFVCDVSKTFLFVRFSLLTVFVFVIAVAVMSQRKR